MTIVSIHNDNPLIDGRQSDRAMMVRRGVQRMLMEMRHAVLPELTLASGRRADLISLSDKGEIWIVEIKTSIEDFRVDRKWPDYRRHCGKCQYFFHSTSLLDSSAIRAANACNKPSGKLTALPCRTGIRVISASTQIFLLPRR